MDEDVFDAIVFEGDPIVYKYAQGYENFIKTLAKNFRVKRKPFENIVRRSKKSVANFLYTI